MVNLISSINNVKSGKASRRASLFDREGFASQRLKPGQAHHVPPFDRQDRRQAPLGNCLTGAVAEPCFGAGFYHHLAILPELVNRQVADFAVAAGLHFPTFGLEGSGEEVAPKDGRVAP